MCIVCSDWQKNKLNIKEALGNLGELLRGATEKEKEHYLEVSEKLLDADLPTPKDDTELDQKWHEEMYGDD